MSEKAMAIERLVSEKEKCRPLGPALVEFGLHVDVGWKAEDAVLLHGKRAGLWLLIESYKLKKETRTRTRNNAGQINRLIVLHPCNAKLGQEVGDGRSWF